MNNNITITLTEKQAEVLYWALNSSRTKWANDIATLTRRSKVKNAETIQQWTDELNNLIDVQSLIPASVVKI